MSRAEDIRVAVEWMDAALAGVSVKRDPLTKELLERSWERIRASRQLLYEQQASSSALVGLDTDV